MPWGIFSSREPVRSDHKKVDILFLKSDHIVDKPEKHFHLRTNRLHKRPWECDMKEELCAFSKNAASACKKTSFREIQIMERADLGDSNVSTFWKKDMSNFVESRENIANKYQLPFLEENKYAFKKNLPYYSVVPHSNRTA